MRGRCMADRRVRGWTLLRVVAPATLLMLMLAAPMLGELVPGGDGRVGVSQTPTVAQAPADPVVTPVSGPSWLKRRGLTFNRSSLGRVPGRLGPPPGQPGQAGQGGPPSLTIGKTVAFTGADLYRLNCQACHTAEGTGAPPEIRSVLGPVQGTSLELVRKQLEQQHKAPAAARAQADKARADLYKRIQKGGDKMPPLAHLQRREIDALYAYLTELAGSPDAKPQRRLTLSSARVGEHVVKGTCHICHDAVGLRPTARDLEQGVIPPLTVLLEDQPVRYFVRKARSGAPVTRADVPFHYRGRMPVFPYLRDEELAAAYLYLMAYPPKAEAAGR
jgi:mono/diheme cytochrome c family protein